MAKTEYQEGTFGAYLVKLLKEKNYTQSRFAEDLKVSKTYLFDVFHNRINPPTPEKQEEMILLLDLSETERYEFLDIAAMGRGELPKDVVDFLFKHKEEIQRIRTIKKHMDEKRI